MFSSYFQYISLIQYAQKYIILVGAHKLQKHSLQNEKCFTVVLLHWSCIPIITVPIYTLIQMTKKKLQVNRRKVPWIMTEGKLRATPTPTARTRL